MTTNRNEIITALKTGLCTFTYEKLNGETRVAIGTLNPILIPESAQAKEDQVVVQNPRMLDLRPINYYDTGAKDWRCFHAENVRTLSLTASA
jgi:hypothetical protein